MASLTTAAFQFNKIKRDQKFAVQPSELVEKLASVQPFQKEKPSYSLMRKRMQYVEENAINHFSKNNIQQPDFKPMANGYESLVFDCSNGYVLKVRTGKPYNPKMPSVVLSPQKTGYSPELNTTYDIFDKIEPLKEKISYKQKLSLFFKCLQQGRLYTDTDDANLGYRYQDNKKTLCILDAGAVQSFNARGVYRLAHMACRQVGLTALYMNMPFLHKPWRQFKAGVKNAMHI